MIFGGRVTMVTPGHRQPLHMSCQDPHKRPTIQQVTKRLQRLAAHEAELEKYLSSSSSEGLGASTDVDARRSEYFQKQQQQQSRTPDRERQEQPRSPPPQPQEPQHQQLQRELEALRQKIRQEERKLESVMEKRYRAEAQPAESSERVTVSPSTSTKQLLRLLRWGTTDEQTQALRIMDKDQVEHSAMEILRHNGLDIIVACMKHGHSSEFRQSAIDILQSISTAGNGLYLDAVLEHGVVQVLMGVLHYRRVATEQRRAGQFLVVLATRSTRVRSLFLQNAGLELLIKVLWDNQLAMFDRHLKSRCDASVIEDMRKFLAAHGEVRWKEADRAMERNRDREAALEKYTEAIVLDPRNGKLYAKRSAVYFAFRKFEHAAADAQQCIRFLPQYGEGYFRHAIALYAMGQVSQADRAVRQGRTLDLQYFDTARMSELALHAPRDRGIGNRRAWDLGSVDF